MITFLSITYQREISDKSFHMPACIIFNDCYYNISSILIKYKGINFYIQDTD
jgi:hypothetical protein